MAYEPLHHKYRPQTFAALVGQEAIAATLTNAIRQRKIAPAYLFTGARGTGKTSSARILAKSLNCLNSPEPTPQPCGQCDVCQAIARGTALDVIEIDAASNTGVDNIRELIERAQFAPVQCRYKVYIIDEVHMLSTAAFNALLKTLEEPPDRVVFVLATTDPQRVLATIISRCQRFDYRRIPLDAMVQHLRQIAKQENIPATDEAVTLVGQMAQGGLRDAESLLDQLSLLTGEIGVEQVWDLVGSVPERDLLDLLQAIAQDNPETLLDSTRRLMDRGREPLIVLQNLASFYRDLLIAKTAPKRNDLVAMTAATWQQLCTLAQQLATTAILAGQQELRKAEVQIKNTTQPRLWLEVTLLGLLPSAIAAHTAPPATTVPAPTQTPAPSTPRTASPPAAPPPAPSPTPAPEPDPSAATPPPPTPATPSPAETSAEPAIPSSDLTSVWQAVIREINPYSTQVMVKQQCHLLGFDGHTARLGVSSQPLFKMAQGKLPNIEAAFQKVFSRKVHILLEVGAGAPPSGPVASVPPPPKPSPDPLPPPKLPPTPATPLPPPTSPPPPTIAGDRPEPLPPPSSFTPEASPNHPMEAWETDEVDRAARNLATFFAGTVIDGDNGTVQDTASNTNLKPSWDGSTLDIPDGAEDDDVPF